MSTGRVVVIGTSAGGIDALRVLVAGLPSSFQVPIAVVVHTAPESPGVLHEILARAGSLRAVSPRDHARLQPGVIYVAPPDCHLLLEPGRVRVTKGPRENRFRPAIDPLFRSAAQVFGPLAIGVVLTGNLDDGTAGLATIKQLGGTAIVQDPADALYPGMPQSAIAHVDVDYVVPLKALAALLVKLTAVHVETDGGGTVPDHIDIEVNIAKEENALAAGLKRIAEPSSYACPECHGVLLQLKAEGRIRFRCHTGHAYSLDSLLAAVSESVDATLWTAVRALEEEAMLLQQLADHAETHHGAGASRELAKGAASAHQRSEVIRSLTCDPVLALPAEDVVGP